MSATPFRRVRKRQKYDGSVIASVTQPVPSKTRTNW